MDRPRLSSQACAAVESAHDLITDALDHWRDCQTRGHMTGEDIQRHIYLLESTADQLQLGVGLTADVDERDAILVAEIRGGLDSPRATRLRAERASRLRLLSGGLPHGGKDDPDPSGPAIARRAA